MFQMHDIQAFLYVAKYKSFSVASREMFLSQATVSMRIKSLEEAVGVQLLRRNKNQVRLTEAGQVFLRYAQDVLAVERDAMDALMCFRQGVAGTLTIAASATVCGWILPQIFKKVYETCPDIEIVFQTCFTEDIINKVADGSVQFGVVRSPFPFLADKRFSCKLLAKDNIYFAAHKNHSIFRKQKITLADIAKTPLIVYASGVGYWPHIKNIFDDKNLKPNIAFHINDLYAATILADLGAHVCCLSEVVLQESIKNGNLRIIPVDDYVPVPRYSMLIYRCDINVAGVMKKFLSLTDSFEMLEWPSSS